MHEEFYNNFKQFKDVLDMREETNFKYLRFRLDFNLYYQMKNLAEMGADEDQEMDADDLDNYGDEGLGDYGD